ncbi:hypothetical protein [Micromonospora sp. NBC_01813]|uniref:hypothetical protein n=1 Tax=Micromonospora sp. NBC_01813 TaxID=2975988 RepID=UPI002DD89475|nr:hypothetical protein [Micromonospora sp. NBC_01813]WSA07385.1 hypothetical protein OG958_24480 [Micromonospora sp. NBC_01813]
MPDAAVPPTEPPHAPVEELTGYLLAELRAAGSTAVRAGAEPAAVTADLDERLRRVQAMLAAVEDATPAVAPDGPPLWHDHPDAVPPR